MDTPVLTATAGIPAGTRLGKYEVLGRLGSGGMAEVYVARAHGAAGVTQLVVIKRILPHLSEDPEFVEMFLNEARITASLDHPNIAHVKEVGDADGSLFLALEHVHGVDVRALLRGAAKGAPVPLGAALCIVATCAEALHHAHERAIVHRDLSPSNVMVTYDGHVKLLDFGIAKAVVTSKTRTGTIKGKVGYMSPEQCMAGDIDRRTDVFSLGVLLYELTLRRRLFKGDSDFAVMNQITLGRITTPREVEPEYPAALEALILKAVEVDREKRFQTAAEFAKALTEFGFSQALHCSRQDVAEWIGGLFPVPPAPFPEPQVAAVRPGTRPVVIPTQWTLPGERSRRRGATIGIVGAALGIALGAAVTGILLSGEPEPPPVDRKSAAESPAAGAAEPGASAEEEPAKAEPTQPPQPTAESPDAIAAAPADEDPSLAAARRPSKRRGRKKRRGKPKATKSSGSSLFPPSRAGGR